MASVDALIRLAGGPETVQTVIDVDANDGADSLPYARRYPRIDFIAVEPTAELAKQLQAESQALRNYTVIQCAIGRTDSEGLLHVRRSSVHNSLEPIDTSSVGRTAVPLETFDILDRIAVSIRTLESLCGELGIDRIDVLHVDAQGADMDVLISAGRFLETVRAGVVEVASGWKLYANSVGRREFIRFLVRKGFQVVRIEANDPNNYEQNVFFNRARNRYLGVARTFVVLMRADLSHGFRRARARVRLRTRLRRGVSRLGGRSPRAPTR